MSWILSASGKLGGEVAHLEQEFVDELHALLAKFGMQFAHFQGPTVDRLTTGATAAPAPPVASAEAPPASEAAPATDPTPETAKAETPKAAAKTTAGG
jgi:uncharacterized iron-regulated membrane protein